MGATDQSGADVWLGSPSDLKSQASFPGKRNVYEQRARFSIRLLHFTPLNRFRALLSRPPPAFARVESICNWNERDKSTSANTWRVGPDGQHDDRATILSGDAPAQRQSARCWGIFLRL